MVYAPIVAVLAVVLVAAIVAMWLSRRGGLPAILGWLTFFVAEVSTLFWLLGVGFDNRFGDPSSRGGLFALLGLELLVLAPAGWLACFRGGATGRAFSLAIIAAFVVIAGVVTWPYYQWQDIPALRESDDQRLRDAAVVLALIALPAWLLLLTHVAAWRRRVHART